MQKPCTKWSVTKSGEKSRGDCRQEEGERGRKQWKQSQSGNGPESRKGGEMCWDVSQFHSFAKASNEAHQAKLKLPRMLRFKAATERPVSGSMGSWSFQFFYFQKATSFWSITRAWTETNFDLQICRLENSWYLKKPTISWWFQYMVYNSIYIYRHVYIYIYIER